MASPKTVQKTASTSSKLNTPPQTPTQAVGPIISPHHIQQLLDILSRAVPSGEESKIKLDNENEPSKGESKSARIEVDNENEKKPKARASKLEFKILIEMCVSLESE
jgi:hypothetical protein